MALDLATKCKSYLSSKKSNNRTVLGSDAFFRVHGGSQSVLFSNEQRNVSVYAVSTYYSVVFMTECKSFLFLKNCIITHFWGGASFVSMEAHKALFSATNREICQHILLVHTKVWC